MVAEARAEYLAGLAGTLKELLRSYRAEQKRLKRAAKHARDAGRVDEAEGHDAEAEAKGREIDALKAGALRHAAHATSPEFAAAISNAVVANLARHRMTAEGLQAGLAGERAEKEAALRKLADLRAAAAAAREAVQTILRPDGGQQEATAEAGVFHAATLAVRLIVGGKSTPGVSRMVEIAQSKAPVNGRLVLLDKTGLLRPDV